MKTNVRKSVSAFLTLCMLFGLFIIVDQPVMINAASAALTNTSTVSAETVKAGETFTAVASATGGTGFYSMQHITEKLRNQNGQQSKILVQTHIFHSFLMKAEIMR